MKFSTILFIFVSEKKQYFGIGRFINSNREKILTTYVDKFEINHFEKSLL